MWIAPKGLVVLFRIPKYVGVLVFTSKVWRTIISGAIKVTDALCLILNMGGDIGNVTGNLSCAHCVTAFVIGSLLVIPHLLILLCREIPILGVRIVCLGYVSAGADVRLGWEATLPVTPASSVPTTISASTTSLPTVTTLATTTGVNVRYLEMINTVTILAEKKVVGNMEIITGEIAMQSRDLDLGNAMINVLCLDTLK